MRLPNSYISLLLLRTTPLLNSSIAVSMGFPKWPGFTDDLLTLWQQDITSNAVWAYLLCFIS